MIAILMCAAICALLYTSLAVVEITGSLFMGFAAMIALIAIALTIAIWF